MTFNRMSFTQPQRGCFSQPKVAVLSYFGGAVSVVRSHPDMG
jgi:hypothetical protein